MRGHYLQHVPFEKPGIIQQWFNDRGGVLTRTQLYREPEFPSLDEIDFLLVLGGPMGANDEEKFPWLAKEKVYIEKAIDRSVPTMGICLGAQLIVSVLGGSVYPAPYSEVGWLPVSLTEAGRNHSLLRSWPEELTVFHWHGDTYDLPEGAESLVTSQGCDNQSFVYEDTVLGFQFHTEMKIDDIQYMLDFVDDHDMKGPYVQDESTIREGLENADRTNALMRETLDTFLE